MTSKLFGPELALSPQDILEAMRQIPGYVDITPADFAALYHVAFEHAQRRLASRFRAEDLMTTDVISVTLHTPIAEVARSMSQHGVSGVPVIDEARRVAGVISEQDFLRSMGRRAGTFMHVVSACLNRTGCLVLPMRALLAKDIMTAPAITIEPSTPLQRIADLFTESRINRAPVVDPQGRLVGIVTRADLVRAATALER